jgi:hypothetical protein
MPGFGGAGSQQAAMTGGGGGMERLLGLLGGPGGAALLSFLPSLLGAFHLFGKDPQAELRKKIAMLSAPGNLQKQTAAQYQQAISSPAFAAAQGNIAGGANAAQGAIAQNLGARGLGSTGLGALGQGIGASLAGNQLGQLQAGAYGQAQNAAQSQIAQQLQALIGLGAGPSQGQQLGAGGLQALAQYFANRG